MQNVFAVGFFIPLVLLSIYFVLFFNTIRYELDERYVTKSSGVLWKKRRSIPLEKITNLDVRQGPFERIFGYGKIWVFTPSTGAAKPEEQLLGIPNPHEMKETIIARSEAAKLPQNTVPSEKIINQISNNDVVALLSDIRDSLVRIESSLSQNNEEL